MINKLILGTVQFGLEYGINNKKGKPPMRQSFAVLDKAYMGGIKRLDTADAYGNAIDIIGEYHTNHGIFKILSKFNFSDNDYDIFKKVKNTQKILGINTFEVYSYHSFKDFISNKKTQEKLSKLKQQKLINKIGISIYTNQEFEIVIDSDIIDVIQIPFNILDNYNKKGALIARAKQKGKEIHARSVFLQGLFFMDETDVITKLKPLVSYLERIKNFCKKQEIPVNELALMYVISNPEIDGVLIGVDNVEQLTENLNCLKCKHTQAINDFVNTLDIKEIELLNPTNWK